MREFRRVEVVLLIVLGAGGCGGETPRLPDATACKAAWQPLSAPQPFDVISGLLYQGGTLYYASNNAQAVLAAPTDGSAATALAPVATLELWLEGDHLLYAGGDLANQIYSLPLAGGTPQLVLDGGAGRPDAGLAMAHAFTATDFYWLEESLMTLGTGSSTVWHQPRSGGAAAQIGATGFTTPDGSAFPGTAIALGGDAVPLAPPAASAELNVESSLAGLDALGAYWSVPAPGTQPGSLMLSAPDGSPAKPFLPGSLGDGLVQRIWPVPEGGWVVASLELYSDGVDHMTIWMVDAQGHATRLACSPGIASDSWIERSVAVAPDAVYVPAENLSANTWEIDRVAR